MAFSCRTGACRRRFLSGRGRWWLSLGIGAELGTGRLTGFLDPDFRL
ncbi:MAG: hypothetical protein IT534_13210 [Bauldia sp.]|nr:hypothetical protein [Bauldia sp.]